MAVKSPTMLPLGIGLYSVREAALYARIRPQMMARWVFGNQSGDPVIDHQIKSPEKIVSFLDFVQAMAVRSVRLERKIPLPSIRKAIRITEEKYGITKPFARRHTTYLVGDEIVIKLGDDYIQVTGKHANNRVITKVAEFYMIDVGFDAEGLASKYTPLKDGPLAITMDPQIRFGEPLLPSCGYTAKAIWDGFRAEGNSLVRASRVFGISPKEVEFACRYYENLLSLAV